jgi:hypothetical protein
MVRSSGVTPRFRLGNRGSIPLRTTKLVKDKKNYKMANHKSKRELEATKRRVLNRYQHKTTRNAIKH